MKNPPELLLCDPKHFEILYEINPWMHRQKGADPARAQSQWAGLYQTLVREGAQIELITPQPGLPDMVFTANAGLVRHRKFFPSQFFHSERRGEEPWFTQWFQERGYEIIPLPKGCFFEGEGDALSCDDLLFCGYRFRSDVRGHEVLSKHLGELVVSLELVDPRWYHLDTCFCPLGPGLAMWYPPAFEPYSQQAVRRHVKELVEVSEQEALHFACNAVVLGQKIILPEGTPELQSKLRGKGFAPIELPMSEFLKSGGACKCLTLWL